MRLFDVDSRPKDCEMVAEANQTKVKICGIYIFLSVLSI